MHFTFTRQLILQFSLMLLFASMAFGQGKFSTINGVVKTSDGKPAADVNIGLVGTNRVTSTNEEGKYQFHNVKAGQYLIKLSAIGLASQEKSITLIAGQDFAADFTLAESAAALQEVVVSGRVAQKKPTQLGKSNISLQDLPQSVGVISNTVIEDQQAVRLGDVLKNVSGVSLTQSRGGVAETFSARGYSIGIAGSAGSIFKNGTLSNTQGFPDASTLESIEVLKGSSALLYGSTSGGVIINMVTKKPKFDWGGQVSMLYGSYNQYKPMVDVYGPISKNLAFRVVATHENAESYRDVVKTKRTYVTPSLLYKIGEKTDILLQADFLKSDIVPDAGVGVPNARITITELPDAPRNRFINTSWAYNNTKQQAGYLTINHRFNSDWKLTAIGSLQDTEVDGFGVGVPTAIAANGDYTRSLSGVNTGERNYTAQLNLNGEFNTGSIKHQVLVGTDAARVTTRTNALTYTSGAVTGTSYDKINIFDDNKFVARTDVPTINNNGKTVTPQNRFGVYAQDFVSLTQKIKVMAGLRWSFQKAIQSTIYTFATDAQTRGTTPNKEDKAFSPKVALVYQPIQSTSLYVSYANNFNFNTGLDIDGNNLKPSIIDQYEFGAKNELLKGKLFANFSVYRIKNNNFSQPAIDQNGALIPNVRTLNGETTSDGLDFDVNANLDKNFYFIVGYGYNYMRYTNTNGAVGSQVEGERLINNPKHTANAAIFYTLATTKLKGLKLGAAAFYTGKRNGGNNNVNGINGGLNNTTSALSAYDALIPLSGFVTVDLSVGYTYHNISLLAKLANIGNTMNYIVHDRYSLNPIPPRQFATTLSYKF
jgi:iron complex outermembrane receptor protein